MLSAAGDRSQIDAELPCLAVHGGTGGDRSWGDPAPRPAQPLRTSSPAALAEAVTAAAADTAVAAEGGAARPARPTRRWRS